MTTEKPVTQETAKILVVGRDMSARSLKSDLLRQSGFELAEVENAKEALKCLADDIYGLVLIDMDSQAAEALAFCRTLKRAYPALSVLLTASSSAVPAELPERLESLADGLLFEPIAPLELVTLVRSFLRLNRLERTVAPAVEAETLAPAEVLQARMASLYASSIDAIMSIDEHDAISSWNGAAERLFGYPASEVLGQRLPDSGSAPDVLAERHQYLQRLHDGEPIEFQAIRHRKNGEPIEIWVRGAPMKGPDGRIVGASFIIRDITALKQREQHVHFLMRELTHRSKNLLAVIQAMARQSLSHLSSPEEFVTRFSERLSGLAGSHDLLSNVDWEGASLIDLIRSQLRHYEDRFDERFHLEGPDLFLRPEAAQNIGIALHELSTNAAKYGALSVPDGKVSISWQVKTVMDIPRLQMVWKENGGPAVTSPGHKGFGHVVMDRITGQALGGTSHADFNAEGVTWQLDVPARSIVIEREKTD